MPINYAIAANLKLARDETTIVGGDATTKITHWAATVDTVNDRLVSNGGSPMPLVRTSQGTHISSGVVRGNQSANGLKSAGTQVDPGNMMVAGVIAFCKGDDNGGTGMVPWSLGFDKLYMQRNPQASNYTLSFVGSGSTLSTTELTPANKIAYVLKTRVGSGARLVLSTGTTYTTGTDMTPSTTGGEAAFETLNQTNGGGLRFRGAEWVRAFWDNSTGQQSNATQDAVLAALMTAYNIPAIANVNRIIAICGDSYPAGQEWYGGDSLALLLGASFPTARIISVPVGGKVLSEVKTEQIPQFANNANFTLSKTYTDLAVIMQAGTNNILTSTAVGTDYQTIANSLATNTLGISTNQGKFIYLGIPPISNLRTNPGQDASVKVYEDNRTTANAALAGTTGVSFIRYDQSPTFAVPANDGTNAGVANAVRTITQSSTYNIAAITGNSGSDWTMTGSDEIHFRDPWYSQIAPLVKSTIEGSSGARGISGPLRKLLLGV